MPNATGPCDFLVFGDPTVSMCARGGAGMLILPLFDWEFDLPVYIRAALYLLLLLWTFVGVAIVSDVFMSAIEKVASKKKAFLTEGGHRNTAEVWNPTVANLTLMALGSSAPEILLNVIAVFPNFLASELGPSTIVGSAAFNLLVIIGICVVSIPDGGVRRIANLGVYSVTAFFSIFAYVWLLFIISWNTVDVVDPMEAILTFLFFWILVGAAYIMDIRTPKQLELTEDTCEKTLWEMELAIRRKYGTHQLLSVRMWSFSCSTSSRKPRVAPCTALMPSAC